MLRKIETQSDIDKRETRNKLIIGIILIALMLFSTAGYAFLSNERVSTGGPKKTYNGYEFFLNSNGLWQTTIQGQEFQFQYFPNETQDIQIPGFMNYNFYAGQPLYFSSENPDATYEISANLGRFLPRVQNACIAGEQCKDDFPEKNCTSDNIIIIKENNETIVRSDDNCIIISGQYGDLVKLSDSFLYKILGVK